MDQDRFLQIVVLQGWSTFLLSVDQEGAPAPLQSLRWIRGTSVPVTRSAGLPRLHRSARRAERKINTRALEQPVPAEHDGWLEGFTPAVPIAADESVHTAEDLPRLAQLYQVVNVKLDKTGGLTEALVLARAARTAGLGLMTGCMISTSLSIAPALHIAAMSDFVDLDGPIWLKEDRAGGVRDDGGYMLPAEQGFWGTI